jgi:hypothetical protein
LSAAVRAPRQRHALGFLFVVLASAFVAVAVASAVGAGGSLRRWVVAGAAAAVAAWFASLARDLLRRH